jgi:F0F1-type ATP synthase membrane subunit c/vacuolar-type H+-ATPase subunit K
MMVFLLGMKTIATGLCLLPLLGCALGIGIVFAGLLYGISRNPNAYDVVFGISLLGLAMIELFAFIAVIVAAMVFFL